MKIKAFFFFLVTVGFTGCASNSVQTEGLFRTSASSLNFKATVNNQAPYIEQEVGHCGPATLAMAIAATGSPYRIDEITQQVYSPYKSGSLQESMIAAARRQGFLAIPIKGLKALLQELEAGNVVITFENQGLNIYPQWHYALVTGYDLQNKNLIMHSGPHPNQFIDMADFELSWRLTDYWGLVLVPPGKVSASADEMTHLKAAAALEKLEKFEEAKRGYLGILGTWPHSLIARIGLGNIYYRQKDYWSSVQFLKTAHKLYPGSPEALNNLKIAQEALGAELN